MSTIYRRTAATMSAEVGHDVVALQAERGMAFGMEAVTAAVWRLLEQPRDLQFLVAALTEEYEVDPEECRAEVAYLLFQMTAEGLVEQEQA